MLANFCMKSICFMANFAPWRIVLTFGSIHVISVETFACWLSLACNPVYVCRFFLYFLLPTEVVVTSGSINKETLSIPKVGTVVDF